MWRLMIACTVAATCASAALAQSQQDLDTLAGGMEVRLAVVDNRPPRCPDQTTGCFLSELSLRLPDKLAPDLAAGNFRLFFGSVSPVITAESEAFTVHLVNGDLHELEPRAGVKLQPGKLYRIRLWSRGHFFSAYYPLPNMFLVSRGLAPALVTATRPVINAETGLEELPFVAPFTDESRLATATPEDLTRWQTPERRFDLYAARAAAHPVLNNFAVIPQPALIRPAKGRPIDLSHVRLTLGGVRRESIAPAIEDLRAGGVRAGSSGPEIRIRLARGMHAEAYRLTASGGRVLIVAADLSGARYALETLAQEAANEHQLLRPAVVEDWPRFGFRGLHIDLARNFHSKAEVLRIIEQMGRYKLNKLHLHLGDDEGWRLQITRFPELTSVGAFRCYDPSETRCLLPELASGPDRDTAVNGYLSHADYIELLKAAKARGIEVIPSFDMPGHSRAAVRSMEARYRKLIAAGSKAEAEAFRLVDPLDTSQYRSIQNYNDNTLNVCLDSTYRFIDAVLDEVVALHAAAGAPLKTYHIGADETAGAWSGSPACKTLMSKTGLSVAQLGPMFIKRVSQSLARRHITIAGWSDGLDHVDGDSMPRKVQSDIWGDLFTAAPAEADRAEKQGWKTIIAVPNVLYLDVPYAPDPLERGYDWPTRGTDSFTLFSFMPENLAANASIMKNIMNRPTTATEPSDRSPQGPAGAQANLWSETIRRDSIVDYMLFPRLLAFAERAWHRASWESPSSPGTAYSYGDGKVKMAEVATDWSSFAARMPLHLRKLEQAGIQYRIAPPGARIIGGMLEARSEFPSQAIEYRPKAGTWTRYEGPVSVTGSIELRTRSFDGRRTSRVVEVSPN